MPRYETDGAAVRRIREQRKMKLSDLARAVDMDVSTLSKIERGYLQQGRRRSFTFTEALEVAQVLDVDPRAFARVVGPATGGQSAPAGAA